MFYSTLKSGSVLAALLISTAAHAELTAEQVWANWTALSASSGQTVTAASQVREGDTLIVRGVEIASAFDGGSVRGTIDTVNLREPGDGTVEITSSPEYPLVVTTTDPDGTESVVNVKVRQPDLKVIASGSDAETSYDFSAPSLKVAVNDVTVGGKPVDFELEVDLTVLAGKYIVTAGTPAKITSFIAADSAGFTLVTADPETDSTVSLKGTFSAISGTSNGNLLDAAATANMAQALKDGFAADGTASYGKGTLDFDVAEGTDTTTGTATFGSGSAAFGLNAGQLNYGGGAKDVAATFSASGIPVPLGLSYGETSFNLVIPVSKSDVPGDFAFMTRMIDLQLSDGVWSLIDPGSVLPRDPAKVVIDTKGKMNWLIDILDPAQTEAASDEEIPAELHALDIVDLTVRALGGEVTGNGGFTFDNSDTTTFDGVPLPTGKLDLKIVGASGVIDNLIKLGVLPQDQAMAAIMMLGLFAKTVEGAPDTLTSTVEFRDKGLFVNGQRLQ